MLSLQDMIIVWTTMAVDTSTFLHDVPCLAEFLWPSAQAQGRRRWPLI